MSEIQCPCGGDTAGQHDWDCPMHPRHHIDSYAEVGLDPHFHPAQVTVTHKLDPCSRCAEVEAEIARLKQEVEEAKKCIANLSELIKESATNTALAVQENQRLRDALERAEEVLCDVIPDSTLLKMKLAYVKEEIND